MADRSAANVAWFLLAREAGLKPIHHCLHPRDSQHDTGSTIVARPVVELPELNPKGAESSHAANDYQSEQVPRTHQAFAARLEASINLSISKWAEDRLLCKCVARYCNLAVKGAENPVRSTIAAAFSPDGAWLASTHGDHTVKIIDLSTARVACELKAHKRTPWVVRFNPYDSNILASGSLDNDVIVWDLASRTVQARHNYGRPITSVAFCPGGRKLLVAAGHRLFSWDYTGPEVDGKAPVPILLNRYRRSLRAAHFQPVSACPLLLTADVDDVDVLKDELKPMTSLPDSSYLITGGCQLQSQVQAGLGSQDVDLWLALRPDAAIPADEVPHLGSNITPRPHRPPIGVERGEPMAADLLRSNVDQMVEQPLFQPSRELPWLLERVPRESCQTKTQGDCLVRKRLVTPTLIRQDGDNNEQPCIVRLKLLPFDMNMTTTSMKGVVPIFTLEHVVLCSEMGVSFSPCGRYFACCVLCKCPEPDGSKLSSRGRKVVYELRVYSVEPASFGELLQARCIKAAHCLTTIQFSPGSNQLVLAYGRRHLSLCSLLSDGTAILPLYTVLEVYRVADLALLRVMPSADDEVNVAVFHPFPGRGLVYGTKEGRLRLIEIGGLQELPRQRSQEEDPAAAPDPTDMLGMSLVANSVSSSDDEEARDNPDTEAVRRIPVH